MKSEQEIEDLKLGWKRDPIWDIEETEGFEDHENELLAFRKECEQRWTADRYNRLNKKSKDLGFPGNISLAAYIEGLEYRIKALEDKDVS